jgi:hypothetical protein
MSRRNRRQSHSNGHPVADGPDVNEGQIEDAGEAEYAPATDGVPNFDLSPSARYGEEPPELSRLRAIRSQPSGGRAPDPIAVPAPETLTCVLHGPVAPSAVRRANQLRQGDNVLTWYCFRCPKCPRIPRFARTETILPNRVPIHA